VQVDALVKQHIRFIAIKEGIHLDSQPDLQSKVMVALFGLFAEIERSMISSRTKEALARKKSEGKKLGRPRGKLSSVTKLSGKDELIKEYLAKKIPHTASGRLLNVNRLTIRNYIITRKLDRLEAVLKF
jgi:DNA invertase Pin-like site-specific DNA recombinase